MIVAKIKRQPPIFTCAKCVRKADAGRAIPKALKSGSKRAPAGPKPPRIVDTKCLGICPKRAVVVASAAMLKAGTVLVLESADEVTEALSRLGER